MAQVRAEFNFFKPEVKDISYEKIQKLVQKGNVPRYALNSDGKGLIKRLLQEFRVPAAQIDRILAAGDTDVEQLDMPSSAMRPRASGRGSNSQPTTKSAELEGHARRLHGTRIGGQHSQMR